MSSLAPNPAIPVEIVAPLFIALLVVVGCGAPPFQPGASMQQPRDRAMPAQREMILATTTSTLDSGLLDVLVPLFETATGYRVKTVAVGSGAALALAARGEADAVLSHAPDAEKDWMAAGNGLERRLIMHNDFVIVGPPNDPARLRGLSAEMAISRLAAGQAPFVSRSDGSGTHLAELRLWRDARLDPRGRHWYLESGSGMGQTLVIADQREAYTIADRATWLARRDGLALALLVESDPALFNVYHLLIVSPSRATKVPINVAGARAFADFLVSTETQAQIGGFGRARYGQSLFVPDAGKHDDNVGS